MPTFRPRYLYMQESCADRDAGDPSRHYYVSAITNNGWAGYASTRVTTLNTLAAAGNLPDGFIVMLVGGMTGVGGASQQEGLVADADPDTGSDACVAALVSIRNECIALGMARGLILYSGPGTLEADHDTLLAPLAQLGVPIIMDGGGSAAQALLDAYDTATGQTVGIEAAADLNADVSAYARLSLTIDSPAGLWNSDTFAGGLGDSVRADTFQTLDTYTGEWMSFDPWGTNRTALSRRARKVFHDLKMSPVVPAHHWQSGAVLRSDFAEHLSLMAGSSTYIMRTSPQRNVDATPPVVNP